MDGTSRPARRRHAAARSRVAAGLLSAAMFLGLTGGMAANHAGAATPGTTSTSESDSGGSRSDSRSGSSWSATPGSSSGQSPATSSQGS